jgi:hypothetical protein
MKIAKSENEQSEHAKHHFSVARRRRKRPERPNPSGNPSLSV